MPRSARPWFRVYTEMFSDPKLTPLSPERRWLWVAVLAAACESPRRGYLDRAYKLPMSRTDLAHFAHVDARTVARGMQAFVDLQMVDIDDETGAWFVVNWANRQFESDDVTTRTRRTKAKERLRNVPTYDVGTPVDNARDRDRDISLSLTLSHNGTDLAGQETRGNLENETGKILAGQLAAVCKGDNRQFVERESLEVITWALDSLDWRSVEEMVGTVHGWSPPPTLPRAVAAGMRLAAQKIGVQMAPFRTGVWLEDGNGPPPISPRHPAAVAKEIDRLRNLIAGLERAEDRDEDSITETRAKLEALERGADP